MTLYEINEQMRACINEETGEFNEEAWNELSEAREQKIEGACMLYKEKVAMADAIKAEIETLTARMKSAEREQESIKSFLAYALQGEKFETAKVKCGWRKSESVKIEDDVELPEIYCKTKVSILPDKTEIKKALKSGIAIAGCTLVESNNISIK